MITFITSRRTPSSVNFDHRPWRRCILTSYETWKEQPEDGSSRATVHSILEQRPAHAVFENMILLSFAQHYSMQKDLGTVPKWEDEGSQCTSILMVPSMSGIVNMFLFYILCSLMKPLQKHIPSFYSLIMFRAPSLEDDIRRASSRRGQ